MKFKIKATSSNPINLKEFEVKTLGANGFGEIVQEVEIYSLEDLLKIVNEINCPESVDGQNEIIIGKDRDDYYIEIYDDYRD